MRNTDEITYVLREFNKENSAAAIIEAINMAIRSSVMLASPRVVSVEYREFDDGEWFGPDDDRPVPAIRVTVAGS